MSARKQYLRDDHISKSDLKYIVSLINNTAIREVKNCTYKATDSGDSPLNTFDELVIVGNVLKKEMLVQISRLDGFQKQRDEDLYANKHSTDNLLESLNNQKELVNYLKKKDVIFNNIIAEGPNPYLSQTLEKNHRFWDALDIKAGGVKKVNKHDFVSKKYESNNTEIKKDEEKKSHKKEVIVEQDPGKEIENTNKEIVKDVFINEEDRGTESEILAERVRKIRVEALAIKNAEIIEAENFIPYGTKFQKIMNAIIYGKRSIIDTINSFNTELELKLSKIMINKEVIPLLGNKGGRSEVVESVGVKDLSDNLVINENLHQLNNNLLMDKALCKEIKDSFISINIHEDQLIGAELSEAANKMLTSLNKDISISLSNGAHPYLIDDLTQIEKAFIINEEIDRKLPFYLNLDSINSSKNIKNHYSKEIILYLSDVKSELIFIIDDIEKKAFEQGVRLPSKNDVVSNAFTKTGTALRAGGYLETLSSPGNRNLLIEQEQKKNKEKISAPEVYLESGPST